MWVPSELTSPACFLLFLPNSPWLKGEDFGVFQGQFGSAAVDVFFAGVKDEVQRE